MTIIMGYLRVEQRLKLWSYIMRLAPALVKRLSRSRVQGSNPVKLLTFGEKKRQKVRATTTTTNDDELKKIFNDLN